MEEAGLATGDAERVRRDLGRTCHHDKSGMMGMMGK